MQNRVEIFSDRIENAPNYLINTLAVAILKAGLHPKHDVDEPDYDGLFKPKVEWLEGNWDEQIEQLMTKSKAGAERHRGITSKILADGSLEVAIEDLGTIINKGAVFFRARVHKDRGRVKRFALEDLGAPPAEKTPSGRANRKNKPVLYLASDEPTALSEVRAWKGAAVAIAKVHINRPIRVVNLLHLDIPESPFFEGLLDWRLQLGALFHRFGEELSRPVMPHEEKILYKPSQHLSDLIRHNRFDGIIFPSAMGPGHNLVVFDFTAQEILERTYFRVAGVNYHYRELNEHEPIYDETPYDFLLHKDETSESIKLTRVDSSLTGRFPRHQSRIG